MGDAIHNLRTALDHLVWQLVEAGGGTPNDRTAFPIVAADAKAAQRYGSAVGQGEIAKISPGAFKLLESIQPYNGGDKTLVEIHELDIWDKHRLILAVYAVLGRWGLKTPRFGSGSLALESPLRLVTKSAGFRMTLGSVRMRISDSIFTPHLEDRR